MRDRSMRSALFVPASRPDRISKAVACGADAVIVDLEDAVAPEAKSQARDALARHVDAHPQDRLWVRINDGTTPWFEDDLALCRSLPSVAGILLPKAEAPDHVYSVSGAGKPLIPVIESAAGLQALGRIAAAHGVARLSFGILDLLVEFGARPHTEGSRIVLDQIRFQILVASRMHGLGAPLDCVHPDFTDLDAFEQSAALARDMGFGGKLCIHPTQVPVAHRVYQPLQAEIDWARRVVEHADATGEYAFRVDGRMVDLPLIQLARRVLERVDQG